MKNSSEVAIREFGTFKSNKRSARIGRNPSTGPQIDIPEKTVPRFAASKQLKDAVSG